MRQVRRCRIRPCTQSLSWQSKSARSLMHANSYIAEQDLGTVRHENARLRAPCRRWRQCRTRPRKAVLTARKWR